MCAVNGCVHLPKQEKKKKNCNLVNDNQMINLTW